MTWAIRIFKSSPAVGATVGKHVNRTICNGVAAHVYGCVIGRIRNKSFSIRCYQVSSRVIIFPLRKRLRKKASFWFPPSKTSPPPPGLKQPHGASRNIGAVPKEATSEKMATNLVIFTKKVCVNVVSDEAFRGQARSGGDGLRAS